MSALVQAPRPSPRDYGHPAVTVLGSEGAATFYHCGDCGGVFLAQDGHTWFLRRTDPFR